MPLNKKKSKFHRQLTVDRIETGCKERVLEYCDKISFEK
jgi:hypothetical protein